MSTNHHTAIATGANANASTFNTPLGQLDAAIDAVEVGDLADVTVTGTPADNEVLAYDTGTSEWINQTAAEAGLAAASHSHTASDISDLDASEVPYTPTTLTDWDTDADPGNVDDALDQLAERVDDLEGAGSDTVALTYVIDGGGATITTGQKGHLMIPFGGTITEVTALADQSGSIVVDIWKDTYANYPPADADSITAAAPVTITTATKSQDSALAGWTTAITAGDILAFNVDSATTITRLTIVLIVTKA